MRISNIMKYKLNLNLEAINKIHAISFLKRPGGNLSILLIISTLMVMLLLVSLFDIFSLFIAREHTKNASDAIALAVAQNLLFFDDDEIFMITDEISKKNSCEIESIKFDYDEITVTTLKKVKFLFIGKILKEGGMVFSTSKVKVAYPWDERFKNCDFFIFEF